jgi:hypothetical protein
MQATTKKKNAHAKAKRCRTSDDTLAYDSLKKKISPAIQRFVKTVVGNAHTHDLRGECRGYSTELCEHLMGLGYQAKIVQGYYTDVDDDYEPGHWDDEVNADIMNFFRRNGRMPRITHYWVEIANLAIVDVTASQFHPSNPAEYRLVITPITDTDYSCRRRKTRRFESEEK